MMPSRSSLPEHLLPEHLQRPAAPDLARAWSAGAGAEAWVREQELRHQSKDVRSLLDALDSLAKNRDSMTVGQTLVWAVYVFQSTLSPLERAEIIEAAGGEDLEFIELLRGTASS